MHIENPDTDYFDTLHQNRYKFNIKTNFEKRKLEMKEKMNRQKSKAKVVKNKTNSEKSKYLEQKLLES